MKGLLLFVFVCTTLYMNLYKFPIMYNLQEDEAYPIFPWSLKPNPSLSSGVWLMAHLFSAIVTVIVSTVMVAISYSQCTPFLKNIHRTVYTVFVLTILINIHHFGTASVPVAIAANGTPLLISLFGLSKIRTSHQIWGNRRPENAGFAAWQEVMRTTTNNNNFYFVIHYAGIIIPVLFELGMRLMQTLA
ncbi:putative ORFan [Tupanvirus deep ocean]|uniref:ORFan n=2 Tax=Tupanvirus TaxID=2094720 RepID=A0AC62A9C2_9VIRU|nr:putative ORFan [Tupanvirus deep ocean]QKU34376.1 putative ORFan [Tupanvirus deep ocean]